MLLLMETRRDSSPRTLINIHFEKVNSLTNQFTKSGRQNFCPSPNKSHWLLASEFQKCQNSRLLQTHFFEETQRNRNRHFTD